MGGELDRVPQFNVTEIEAQRSARCIGIFDTPIRWEDRWIGYLVSQEGSFVQGRFFAIDRNTGTAAFEPKDSLQIRLLEVGKTHAYLDNYWGERVELVLDASRQWRRELFKPEDVIEYQSGDARIRGKVGQSPTFPVEGEGRRIQDGWDHEHCAICWEKIAEYAQPFGYTDQHACWVCENCYSTYVQRKSLGFVTEAALSQIRGEYRDVP
jgi:hypothetical protein